MPEFKKSAQNRLKRLPRRGSYDHETINAILDEGLICHVGFVHEGEPVVIPTLYARDGDSLLLHGSRVGRLLNQLDGGRFCVTVTLVDGLVLARSAFHHSMNYRSAVLFGRGEAITNRAEKMAALERLSEHIVPGRWKEARPPNTKELAATTVIRMTIESASAKIRTGPPVDNEEDYSLPVWAGVLPMSQETQPPIADERLAAGVSVPKYVTGYRRGKG